MTDCIFCKIASGDIPAEKIFENDHVIGFRDLNPQAPTHVLVIPKKHISTINDLQDDDKSLIGEMFLAARQIAADEGLSERGYRTLINCNEEAGQTVFHIHLHLLGGRAMGWPPG